MSPFAVIIAIKPTIHHLIVSFAFVILSSSHILKVSISDPYAIAHTAATPSTPAIALTQRSKKVLNPHPF